MRARKPVKLITNRLRIIETMIENFDNSVTLKK